MTSEGKFPFLIHTSQTLELVGLINSNSQLGLGTTQPDNTITLQNGGIHIVEPNQYINFGSALGTNGYGIRDSNGIIQFKNAIGS